MQITSNLSTVFCKIPVPFFNMTHFLGTTDILMIGPNYGALSVSKIVRVRHTFIRCHSFAPEVGYKLHEVGHKLREVGQELHEVGYKFHAVRHKLHEVCLFGNEVSLILREVARILHEVALYSVGRSNIALGRWNTSLAILH